VEIDDKAHAKRGGDDGVSGSVGLHPLSVASASPQDGEVALPTEYKQWPKFLSEVQREDVKQVRELYVDPKSTKACPPSAFPNGAKLVMELYKAKPEGEGLARGADGKLVKGISPRCLSWKSRKAGGRPFLTI
jgi:hypothetical protein